MLNAEECREEARRYASMAAEIDNPVLRQRFAETAAGWLRLAADLANLDAQLAAERIDDKDVA